MKKLTVLSVLFFLQLFVVMKAQNTYSLVKADKDIVITGSEQLNVDDRSAFVSALLWAIDKGPKLKENIEQCDFDKLKFTVKINILPDENVKEAYNCNLTIQVVEQRMFFLVNDIVVTTSGILGKRTPFEKLNPEKKEKHQEYYDDFTKYGSSMIRDVLKYIGKNGVQQVPNWNKVKNEVLETGLNEVECKLIMGKPINVHDSGQRVQWMYSTSTYLFFENGRLKTILK